MSGTMTEFSERESGRLSPEFAAALLAAQQEITKVEKNSDNPYFSSKYADLNTVITHVKPILNRNKIVFIQLPASAYINDNQIGLRTILLYAETGETIEVDAAIPISKSDPQAFGSAITYARRYALVSVLGLMTDEPDDDANAASKVSDLKASNAPKFKLKPAPLKNNKTVPAAEKPKTALFPKVGA